MPTIHLLMSRPLLPCVPLSYQVHPLMLPLTMPVPPIPICLSPLIPHLIPTFLAYQKPRATLLFGWTCLLKIHCPSFPTKILQTPLDSLHFSILIKFTYSIGYPSRRTENTARPMREPLTQERRPLMSDSLRVYFTSVVHVFSPKFTVVYRAFSKLGPGILCAIPLAQDYCT